MIHKRLFPILLLFVVLISAFPVNAQENCVQGIDGYCDEDCLEVDFDCARNPHQEARINNEVKENTSDYIRENPYEGLMDTDTLILIGMRSELVQTVDNESENMFLPGYLLGLLLFLILLGVAFLIMHRLELKQGADKRLLKNMQFHIKRLRHHGHSDDEIRKMFLNKHHHPKMIEKAFKALERQA